MSNPPTLPQNNINSVVQHYLGASDGPLQEETIRDIIRQLQHASAMHAHHHNLASQPQSAAATLPVPATDGPVLGGNIQLTPFFQGPNLPVFNTSQQQAAGALRQQYQGANVPQYNTLPENNTVKLLGAKGDSINQDETLRAQGHESLSAMLPGAEAQQMQQMLNPQEWERLSQVLTPGLTAMLTNLPQQRTGQQRKQETLATKETQQTQRSNGLTQKQSAKQGEQGHDCAETDDRKLPSRKKRARAYLQTKEKLDEVIDSLDDTNIQTALKEDVENAQKKRKEMQSIYKERLRQMESRLSVYTRLEGLAKQIADDTKGSRKKSRTKSRNDGAFDIIQLSLKNYRRLEDTSDRLGFEEIK